MLDSTTDPGEYRVKVLGLPIVKAGRYITVRLTVYFDDGEEIAVLDEFFDFRQPRKLIRFLQAIGQPYSETECFNVSPSRWNKKKCNISCVLKEWQDANGQRQQRNIIVEFSPCA